MKHLKILISHSSLYEKSGWGRIFPLATGLTKSGNNVTIITTNPKFSIFIKKKVEKNVTILIFPEIVPNKASKLGFGFLSLILKIFYVLIYKFDVVHSDNGHRPLSGVPCRLHKRLYGSTYIAEWYDWYGLGGQYDSKPKLFKLILGKYELKYEIKDKEVADGVVVLSEVLRIRAKEIKSDDRIIKIHGGADISDIPYVADNKKLKEKYGINNKLVTFGYIDAFSSHFKEVQPLIDAIISLGLDSNVKILLFGRTNSLEESLPKRIQDMILNFGWVNYARDFEKLQCVDVFFTFKENILGNLAGWPNCVGDYLACGRPIFLNPIGEVVEFVKKYPSGFFESTIEKESISMQLKNIIENPTELVKMGFINRKISENEISWQKKSDELLAFYNLIIDKKKHKKML